MAFIFPGEDITVDLLDRFQVFVLCVFFCLFFGRLGLDGGRGEARPAVFDCLFDDPVGVLIPIFVVERFELFEQFDFLFAADFVSGLQLHGDEVVPQFEVYPFFKAEVAAVEMIV